jgi:hypothetical protein
MTAPPVRRPFDWEAAGRELGEKLDEYHSVVIAGMDPVATGRVAVGLARAQSGRRRVAVGDLFAESPPIQELVQTDDPHGIVDSFLYGVSLTKIARHVPEAGQLYVMPSGTEPPAYDEILSNPRWHRLTAGFREVGALMVLAAPTSAPQLEKLVAATDGVVFVGDAKATQIPAARVIGSVREPRPRPSTPIMSMPHVSSGMSRGQMAAFAGIGLTLVAAAIAAWLAYRPLAGGAPFSRREPDCATLAAQGHPCVPRPGQPTVAMTPDSARSDSTRDSTKSPAVVPTMPVVVNPGDSAAASAFAVQMIAENMQAGAILRWQRDSKNLPAATFSPVIIQGVRWFKMVSGAFATAAGADSLLTRLRQQNVLRDGSVVRLPFAFRIDSGVPAKAVSELISTYGQHGQPVYALRQADGTAWLLVGAYESPEQALLYLESLPSGTRPVLVYRKGRSF